MQRKKHLHLALSQHREHRKRRNAFPDKQQQSRSKATRLVRLLHPSDDFQQGHEHSSALIPVKRASTRSHRNRREAAEPGEQERRKRASSPAALRNTPTLASSRPRALSASSHPIRRELFHSIPVGRPAALEYPSKNRSLFNRMLYPLFKSQSSSPLGITSG